MIEIEIVHSLMLEPEELWPEGPPEEITPEAIQTRIQELGLPEVVSWSDTANFEIVSAGST